MNANATATAAVAAAKNIAPPGKASTLAAMDATPTTNDKGQQARLFGVKKPAAATTVGVERGARVFSGSTVTTAAVAAAVTNEELVAVAGDYVAAGGRGLDADGVAVEVGGKGVAAAPSDSGATAEAVTARADWRGSTVVAAAAGGSSGGVGVPAGDSDAAVEAVTAQADRRGAAAAVTARADRTGSTATAGGSGIAVTSGGSGVAPEVGTARANRRQAVEEEAGGGEGVASSAALLAVKEQVGDGCRVRLVEIRTISTSDIHHVDTNSISDIRYAFFFFHNR